MSSDREVTSEQLPSVCEGTGYNEIYLSRCEPVEDLTWSLEREPSAHSLAKKEEEYEEDEEKGEEKGCEGEEEEEEGECDEEGQAKGDGVMGQIDDSGHKPFILPLIWTVNDFYPTMSQKVFDTLCNHYQIPKNIPLRLPRMFEKCYSRKTVDVGMYDAIFTAGLRLPLTELHHQLANYLGLSVSQIAANAWRKFIRAVVI